MTSTSVPRFVAALLAVVIAGCAEHHEPTDAAVRVVDADRTRDDASDAGPRTCELVAGTRALRPASDNPPGCMGIVDCRIWFGHGQHLSCPADSPNELCLIRDCVCRDWETERFVADLSTGEIVDARDPARTCRYSLLPAP